MEVRGGCGYIEEWPEPRLLRDAHLGSIWEGASNVVALDVLRAVRKDGGLEALLQHVRSLLTEAPLDRCEEALVRASGLVERALDQEALARSAASALYNISSAAVMTWEGLRTRDPNRVRLARMVLQHRVLPRDPLDAPSGEPDGVIELLEAA